MIGKVHLPFSNQPFNFPPQPSCFTPQPSCFTLQPSCFTLQPSCFTPQPFNFPPQPSYFPPQHFKFPPQPFNFPPQPASSTSSVYSYDLRPQNLKPFTTHDHPPSSTIHHNNIANWSVVSFKHNIKSLGLFQSSSCTPHNMTIPANTVCHNQLIYQST